MKVYFSHGKESGPWGSKIKKLAAIAETHGCAVESVDYRDVADPDLRVERLVGILKDERDSFVLVGSSMGAYVSLVAAEQVKAKGLFLLAPALYIQGYQRKTYQYERQPIEIVHGWSDDVIPSENSFRFAKEADCALHLISGDHRLNGAIEVIEGIFDRFVRGLLNS